MHLTRPIVRTCLASLALALVAGQPHSALAQTARPSAGDRPTQAGTPPPANAARWTDRAYVGINAVYQGGGQPFSETFTFPQYGESGQVTTSYPGVSGTSVDVGGGVRVWRNVSVGASVSYFTKSGTASVQASVPHPLYLAQDRQVSGTFAPSRRTETALNVHAAWVMPAGKRVLLTVAGGPSVFSVRQSLVNGVRWTQTYPYDTAQYSGADAQQATKTAVGFNGGADVAYFFSRTIGVGGFARYARASVRLGADAAPLAVDAGGFQVGAGLRVRIPAAAAVKRPIPAAPPRR